MISHGTHNLSHYGWLNFFFFLQQFIWASNKEMIKAIDHWPFMRVIYFPVIQKASPLYDIIITECTTFADVWCIVHFISSAQGNVVGMCYFHCLHCVKEWWPRSLYIKRSYVQADAHYSYDLLWIVSYTSLMKIPCLVILNYLRCLHFVQISQWKLDLKQIRLNLVSNDVLQTK